MVIIGFKGGINRFPREFIQSLFFQNNDSIINFIKNKCIIPPKKAAQTGGCEYLMRLSELLLQVCADRQALPCWIACFYPFPWTGEGVGLHKHKLFQ